MSKLIWILILFTSACSLNKDTNRAHQINIQNENLFDENGACFIGYNANISFELLKKREVKKIIANDYQHSGFWIYTTPDLNKNTVDIATMDDIVTVPLKKDINVISKSKKFGAQISKTGELTIGYFYTSKFMCFRTNDLATTTIINSSLLE